MPSPRSATGVTAMKSIFGKNNKLSVGLDLATLPGEIDNLKAQIKELNDRIGVVRADARTKAEAVTDKQRIYDYFLATKIARISAVQANGLAMSLDEWQQASEGIIAAIRDLAAPEAELNAARAAYEQAQAAVTPQLQEIEAAIVEKQASLVKKEEKLVRKKAQMNEIKKK